MNMPLQPMNQPRATNVQSHQEQNNNGMVMQRAIQTGRQRFGQRSNIDSMNNMQQSRLSDPQPSYPGNLQGQHDSIRYQRQPQIEMNQHKLEEFSSSSLSPVRFPTTSDANYQDVSGSSTDVWNHKKLMSNQQNTIDQQRHSPFTGQGSVQQQQQQFRSNQSPLLDGMNHSRTALRTNTSMVHGSSSQTENFGNLNSNQINSALQPQGSPCQPFNIMAYDQTRTPPQTAVNQRGVNKYDLPAQQHPQQHLQQHVQQSHDFHYLPNDPNQMRLSSQNRHPMPTASKPHQHQDLQPTQFRGQSQPAPQHYQQQHQQPQHQQPQQQQPQQQQPQQQQPQQQQPQQNYNQQFQNNLQQQKHEPNQMESLKKQIYMLQQQNHQMMQPSYQQYNAGPNGNQNYY
eukprot:CAMPEP_0201136604 /NCGR_PEP_ID=MMETSP0850-20130426/54971_1 /ASSEMBLY_ACC=CAM_ASM_000622 /TAXON_ID=183588 /ORGANISM="Pseudo-nitzschia fraudulenta, Strain WWA7" /LENGTH=397 /DNA_ID=CAMNT_0047407915 /DNA_START=143 /DNA_END=1336 /DNA_ORIENTATION=-